MNDENFKQLVIKYEKLVLSICYQFVHDSQLAEDLAQDTFISAYTHMDSCPNGAEKPWLARIAANKAKDYLKSAYNRRVCQSDMTEETLPDSARLFSSCEPENICITNEGVNAVKEKIYGLKEPYLMVSVMFFLEQRTVEEIARQLDRPPKTIHTQLYRAKMMLRKSIKEVT